MLAAKDKRYIERNSEKYTDAELADKLHRPLHQIRKYRVEYMGISDGMSQDETSATKVKNVLKGRPEWKEFRAQFTKDELALFEYTYVNLMAQFKNDVLVTEEKQIFQAIELEIFLNRNKRYRKQALDEIIRLKKLLNKALNSDKDESETYISGLERQIQFVSADEHGKTMEYKTLLEKYEAIMKSLKATRDQRIKNIESSTKSFVGFLKALEDNEVREQEGRQMELLKLAIDKERGRLSSYHEYDDKSIDRPLLNAESVMLDED